MNKKHYAQPTMKVVELDMADIVCNSPENGGDQVTRYGGNAGFDYVGGSTTDPTNRNRANGRGIWDED